MMPRPRCLRASDHDILIGRVDIIMYFHDWLMCRVEQAEKTREMYAIHRLLPCEQAKRQKKRRERRRRKTWETLSRQYYLKEWTLNSLRNHDHPARFSRCWFAQKGPKISSNLAALCLQPAQHRHLGQLPSPSESNDRQSRTRGRCQCPVLHPRVEGADERFFSRRSHECCRRENQRG